MKFTSYASGVFLGATKTDYTRKSDGQPSAYYNVSVKQGTEVGTISCPQVVYDQYMNGLIKDFQKCDFTTVYDDRYNRLQVVEITPTK